jgi:hypothetical protein
MEPTTRRTTSSLASSCIVQQVRPSGGLLHASAISVAWPRSSSLLGNQVSETILSQSHDTDRNATQFTKKHTDEMSASGI